MCLSFPLVMGNGRFNFPAAMNKGKEVKHLHLIEGWTFTSKNYIIFIVGVLLIFLGYVVMAAGETYSVQSLTIAPIMLFLGYVVVIPAALIYQDKK